MAHGVSSLMAWLDDRAWCHPKLIGLTDKQFRVYVNGLTYAAGMGTRGTLTQVQQRLVGSEARIRSSLILAGLWEERGSSIYIHDWDEHNGKRDLRREADKQRKRAERAAEAEKEQAKFCPVDSHQDKTFTSSGQSTTAARVEGSEGSEGNDVRTKALLPLVAADGSKPPKKPRTPRPPDPLWEAVNEKCGKASGSRRAKVVNELRDEGATPDDVHRKVDLLQLRWPEITITDTTLLKYWGLADMPLPPGRPQVKKGAMTLSDDWNSTAAAVIARRGLELNGTHDLELEASDG